MTNILKALIAGTALFSLASAASAEPTSKIRFTYDKAATIEKTYDSFSIQAYIACLEQTQTPHKLPRNQFNRFMVKCEKQLMNRVVSKTKNVSLMALHENRTHPMPVPHRYAKAAN
jgi:hypothetical protein